MHRTPLLDKLSAYTPNDHHEAQMADTLRRFVAAPRSEGRELP